MNGYSYLWRVFLIALISTFVLFMAFVLTAKSSGLVHWYESYMTVEPIVTKATVEADGCEVVGLTIDGVWYCIR